MPKPYSLDFRQKVIDAIELNAMKKSEASAVFGISRNTIDLWLKRKAATGRLAPEARSSPSRPRKITDWEAFRRFAEQHRHHTQTEMAERWPGEMSNERSRGPCSRLTGLEKKDLRLHPAG